MMDSIHRKKINGSLDSLLTLHDDILVMIFTRLSFTKILECKTVCKSLYLLLSSPYFADSYKSNPPFTSLVIRSGVFFLLLELKSGYNYSLKSSKPKILPNPWGPYTSCGINTKFLVGSCNGFFCYYDKDLLYVTNPLCGTHVRLPQLLWDGFSNGSYGFGFCPQTQRCKAIEIATYVRPFSRTEVNVLTVGVDKSWRRIHCPFQNIHQRLDKINPLMQFFEVNGKGYLHWIVDGLDRLDYFYSFDILEEKVRPIPTPLGIKKRSECSTDLLSMHGCVCLLHKNNDENRVEFWCMTDYMVQSSWTLRIIYQSSFPMKLSLDPGFLPIAAWKDDEILMLSVCNYIASCNLEHKNFNILDMALPFGVYQEAACFVPNFFSYLETGTTQADTKDVVAARKPGSLSQKNSKPTEVGNVSSGIMDNMLKRVFIKCCQDGFRIWCKFLSDPCVHPSVHHIILCDKASPRFLVELKSDLNRNVKDFPLLAATPSMAKITVLGSCNGLVCVSVFNGRHPGHHQTHNICICNPVLQEVAILPQHDGVKGIRDEVYGFGFSSMTGHYKVLRILTRKRSPGQLEAYVLTVGIDKNWRQVAVGGGTSLRMPRKWPANINKARLCDVPFKNAIHWIAEGETRMMLYAFDIDQEQICLLSPIPGMENMQYMTVYPCLGILGGCLCVCLLTPGGQDSVEYWSMSTYGSVASWTKEYIDGYHEWITQKVVVPVMSWRDEELLMWVEDDGGTFISYSKREENKQRRETKIRIGVYNNDLVPVSYVQSDLSLSDAFPNMDVNKMVEKSKCLAILMLSKIGIYVSW